MNTLERVQSTIIELIENKAKQEELQRARPFLRGDHYYGRLRQLKEREVDLKTILLGSDAEVTRKRVLEDSVLANETVQFLYERVLG